MKFTIAVERDNSETNCFMIVIRDEESDICGIPLRGVSKREATEMLHPCLYAFEYGIGASARARVIIAVAR